MVLVVPQYSAHSSSMFRIRTHEYSWEVLEGNNPYFVMCPSKISSHGQGLPTMIMKTNVNLTRRIEQRRTVARKCLLVRVCRRLEYSWIARPDLIPLSRYKFRSKKSTHWIANIHSASFNSPTHRVRSTKSIALKPKPIPEQQPIAACVLKDQRIPAAKWSILGQVVIMVGHKGPASIAWWHCMSLFLSPLIEVKVHHEYRGDSYQEDNVKKNKKN